MAVLPSSWRQQIDILPQHHMASQPGKSWLEISPPWKPQNLFGSTSRGRCHRINGSTEQVSGLRHGYRHGEFHIAAIPSQWPHRCTGFNRNSRRPLYNSLLVILVFDISLQVLLSSGVILISGLYKSNTIQKFLLPLILCRLTSHSSPTCYSTSSSSF